MIRRRINPRDIFKSAGTDSSNLRRRVVQPIKDIAETREVDPTTRSGTLQRDFQGEITSLVLAVPDFHGGSVNRLDRVVISAAQRLASQIGAESAASVVTFGATEPDLQGLDIGPTVHIEGAEYEGWAPEARCEALVALAESYDVRHFIFPESGWIGSDCGRRLAALLEEKVLANIVRLELTQSICRPPSDAREVRDTTSRILLVDQNVALPANGGECRTLPLSVEVSPIEPRISDLGIEYLPADQVRLDEADFVVGGGDGVTDWDALRQLAKKLNASLGGSRVAADDGHIDRERQIGATGISLSARYYIAFGISGAPQHMQGLADCEHIIAVNTDPTCPLASQAELVVVADATDVARALDSRLSRSKNG